MKPKTTTEVVLKAMARSGPELHPDQIRLDDSVQTDKTKVLTQSDINSGVSGGGGGGGAAPDLTGYAKTDYVDSADNALGALIAANTQAIEDIDIPEGGESYDDTEIKKEVSDLQGAFDTAVIAAQEGAEKLEIELQSYAKKEDIPEGAGPDTRLPYRLGTDKAAKRSVKSGDPSIELVDAEDNFSNVKFHGLGGIKCESTIEGIKVDGSAFATNESVDQKLAALLSPTYVDCDNLPNLTV